MNRSPKIVSKQLIIALGFFTLVSGAFAQKESKTFSETFNVSEDAVLDINTSYADIEFETWDKSTVEITATVELEGATKEEATSYFESMPIEIMGNSQKITVSSKSSRNIFITDQDVHVDLDEMHIEIPEIASFVMEMPEIAPFPEVAEMPPLPTTKAFTFDYEAYKKDGDKYMKKWQKDFQKSFDKKHQKRLEEWAKNMEERAKAMEERLEEREIKRVEIEEKRAEMQEKKVEIREKQRAAMEAAREARAAMYHEQSIFMNKNGDNNESNIFYFSTDGENKNYKIKKNIKIKLPKSTKIKMNVRHGEVKLAKNTRNLNATLSHSSLWATTIDGNETIVTAAYSPIKVQEWNYGNLNTKYSKDISLSKVIDLQLQATSSDITIGQLLKKAYIKNDFGPLHILEFGDDFKELDVSLKNAELKLKLPKVATAIYVKGNASSFSSPAALQLQTSKNGSSTIHKGYHMKDGSSRSIIITSDYSEVVLE
ncbi:hypothetical protein ACOCEA_15410 [Maribacter sp. CXY002]|uniref:hypothetical protein n=1 Tax=Maribacter luteocoastalis TaxID=3407671 RepID=UPI003B671D1A